jgi:excisionase family DNA binding protein
MQVRPLSIPRRGCLHPRVDPVMAGRFLSLEEAARQLGVSVDEVNRLVDRKKLFPMRDGASVKFKADDIDRVARDLGDDNSQSGDLDLDLDLPTNGAAAEEEISLGDPLDGTDSIFSADAPEAKGASQTIVRGEAGQAAASGLSMPSLGGEDVVFGDKAGGGVLDGDDLALESIIGASSPSLARGTAPSGGGSAAGSSLTLDLGDLGKGSGGLGSIAGLSAASGAGAALSGALDSGLSLEDGDVQMSGIDLGGASAIGASGVSVVSGGSGLGGDEFQLGSDTTDDESASVVIATEDTGDSSFFGAAIEGEGSAFSEDLSSDSASVILGGEPGEYSLETPFSALQITGLVCCSLLLLFGGFVMYDLVRTIGSPEGPTLANPLLNAMAETFGWR